MKKSKPTVEEFAEEIGADSFEYSGEYVEFFNAGLNIKFIHQSCFRAKKG